MSIRGIALYTSRALIFAAVVCALYALICRLLRRELRWGWIARIAYLAALIEITVLRGGVDWGQVFAGGRPLPQLIPLHTTILELRGGVWRFIYHTIGNLIWFVPLGWMLRGKRPWTALLAGAALSAFIEIMQYLLMTGTTDVDDILLNALGALLGWGIGRLWKK